MKKPISIFLTAVLFLVATTPQVIALEIRVTPVGMVNFYGDGVLGDVDGTDSPQPEKEAKPAKQVRLNKEEKIRVKREGTKIKVRTGKKEEEVARLKLQAPVEIDEAKSRASMEKEKEAYEQKIKALTELPEATREAKKKIADDQWEERKKQLETLKESRKGREDEYVEVKNGPDEESTPSLSLSSRNVEATLKGAEFSFDPETNLVTLITPSGNEQVLHHLPDQALERIKEKAGASLPATTEAIEVETTDAGEVVYTASTEIEKKFMGLFRRKIKKQFKLNDGTGEVTETRTKNKSLVDQVLDNLSF